MLAMPHHPFRFEYTKLGIEAFLLFKVVHFQVTMGGTLWVTADTDPHPRG
jgi:hypothetical protein